MVGFTQNGTGASARLGFNYLSEIGHIMDFGAAGNAVADDSAAFQYALNACGLNFGTLDITQPPVATGGGINYSGGYLLKAGSTYAAVPPLIWGTGASCRVIIRKGAMISGSLPPTDPAHVIFDENLQPIAPWPSTTAVPALNNSNPLGYVAVTDSQGNTATLSPAGINGAAPPFAAPTAAFAVHGDYAGVASTNIAGSAVAIGPGRSTGSASGSGYGVIVQVDGTPDR